MKRWLLVPIFVVCSAACDPAETPPDQEEAEHVVETREVTLTTPKGERTVVMTRGEDGRWYSGDASLALGDSDPVFRDAIVSDPRKWPGGIVPYYWPIDDSPDCGRNQYAWCEGEREKFEQVTIDPGTGLPSAEGAVARLKAFLQSHTPMTLIDVTGQSLELCQGEGDDYLGKSCVDGIPPTAIGLVRRRWELDDGETVPCNFENNTSTPEAWNISFLQNGPGIWSVALNIGLNPEFPASFADNAPTDLADLSFGFYEALRGGDWCFGCQQPVNFGAVPGDVYVEQAESGKPFAPVVLNTPFGMPDTEIELQRVITACAADGCQNSDCRDSTFVCQRIFDPILGDYDGDAPGLCQRANATADIGIIAPGAPDSAEGNEDDNPPGQPDLRINLPTQDLTNPSLGTLAHEVLHAFGFVHEQNRPDGAEFLQVAKPSCAEPGRLAGDLNLNSDRGLEHIGENAGFGLTPFEPGAPDFISTMMYRSSQACLNDNVGCDSQCLVSRADNNLCPAGVCVPNSRGPGFLIKPDGWTGNLPVETFDLPNGRSATPRVPRPRGYSESDLDALRWFYWSGFRRSVEIGVLHGTEACVADPACVSSPVFAECAGGSCSSCTGPECSPWRGDEPGDRFGFEVTIGSFGDENNAIVAGVPGEALDFPVGSGQDEGMVAVFAGRFWSENRALRRIATHAPSYLVTGRTADLRATSPISSIQPGDEFGSVIETIDLSGDGWPELAVTAPNAESVTVFDGATDAGKVDDFRFQLVGAPGDGLGTDLAARGESPRAA